MDDASTAIDSPSKRYKQKNPRKMESEHQILPRPQAIKQTLLRQKEDLFKLQFTLEKLSGRTQQHEEVPSASAESNNVQGQEIGGGHCSKEGNIDLRTATSRPINLAHSNSPSVLAHNHSPSNFVTDANARSEPTREEQFIATFIDEAGVLVLLCRRLLENARLREAASTKDLTSVQAVLRETAAGQFVEILGNPYLQDLQSAVGEKLGAHAAEMKCRHDTNRETKTGSNDKFLNLQEAVYGNIQVYHTGVSGLGLPHVSTVHLQCMRSCCMLSQRHLSIV